MDRWHSSRDRPSGIYYDLWNGRTEHCATRAEWRSMLGQGLRPAANQIREPRQGDEKTDVSAVIDCDRFFCCWSLHDPGTYGQSGPDHDSDCVTWNGTLDSLAGTIWFPRWRIIGRQTLLSLVEGIHQAHHTWLHAAQTLGFPCLAGQAHAWQGLQDLHHTWKNLYVHYRWWNHLKSILCQWFLQWG
jgi:hypothetical protein